MTSSMTSKVKVIGQRSRSPGKKNASSCLIFSLTGNVNMVKGHLDRGQRSFGSRSKVTLVKVRMFHRRCEPTCANFTPMVGIRMDN